MQEVMHLNALLGREFTLLSKESVDILENNFWIICIEIPIQIFKMIFKYFSAYLGILGILGILGVCNAQKPKKE